MFKKKSKKPIYYKKSKAAKQVEQNYVDYSESEASLTEPQREYYKNPEGRRNIYKKEYEYSGYSDQNDDRKYVYDYRNQEIYDMGNDMYGYMTEESQYPERTRTPAASETAYSEESDSNCELCNKRRREGGGRPMTDASEYTSEYGYREQQPRQRHVHKYERRKRKGRLSDTTETERSPYRKELNVYAARQPVGHRAFMIKQQRQQMMQTDEETESKSETGTSDEESDMPRQARRPPQYQVYAAQVGHNQTGVFDPHQSRRSRERVLSVTNYNRNVPVVAFKDKTTSGSSEKLQSGLVYLPVIVQDKGIKLPNSKVVSPKSLVNKTGEEAEKPFETKMQVYAATDMGQGNIFEQAKKAAAQENTESSLTQNITIYTADQEQTNPLHRKKSAASLAGGKPVGSKANVVPSDYPVQKSYINVAPTKLKSGKKDDKRGSKTSVKSAVSTTSLVGLPKSGSAKGSAYFSKAHKKDMKARKEKKHNLKKQADSDSSSVVLSVVNPTPTESEKKEAKTSTVVSTKNDQQKKSQDNTSVTTNAQQTMRRNFAGTSRGTTVESKLDRKRTVEENIYSTNERRSLAREKSTGEQGRVTGERKSIAGEGRKSLAKEYNQEELSGFVRQSEPTIKPTASAVMAPEKKSLGSRLFSRKKKDSELMPQTESNHFLQHTPENNDLANFQETMSSTSHPTTNQSEQFREGNLKRKPSQRKTLSKKGTVEFAGQKNERKGLAGIDPLILWGYDLTYFLIYAFQIAKLFLGLSDHDKLMEMLETFQGTGHT